MVEIFLPNITDYYGLNQALFLGKQKARKRKEEDFERQRKIKEKKRQYAEQILRSTLHQKTFKKFVDDASKLL